MPSHSANGQMPMPWPNHIPPYMYNFQSPIQHMPSYQGYPFSNMQWPSNMDKSSPSLVRASNFHKNKKSLSRRKEKYPSKEGLEDLEEDRHTESDDIDSRSSSSSDKEQERRHSLKNGPKGKNNRRKSSGTVVIRNINYITPKRKDGNEGRQFNESSDEFTNENSINEKLEIAVGSLEKFRKVDKNDVRRRGVKQEQCMLNGSNRAADQDLEEDLIAGASVEGNTIDNWNTFKKVLMIDERTGTNGPERLQPIDVQDEQFTMRSSEGRSSFSESPALELEIQEVPKQLRAQDDSFIMTKRDGGRESRVKSDEFYNIESSCLVLGKRDCLDQEMLSRKSEESTNNHADPYSTCVAESSMNKRRNDEDWFIVDRTEKRSRDILIDDSFMIQPQLAVDNRCDLHWKTDISMVGDPTSDAPLENSNANISPEKHKISNNGEPNDLCMVLEQDSGLNAASASWTMDYGLWTMELTFLSQKLIEEKAEISKVSLKFSGKNKSQIMYKNKKRSSLSRPIVQKSKMENEEEVRKKMEELLIQRQKRITERTASSGLAQEASRKNQFEIKTAKGFTRSDNNKTPSMRETKRLSSVKVRAS
ncbi:COP1-interacting protein 7 [Quillaja saponaria]|uniref:COP1-interacting protein 7 n=1 Tax=Quillaja saponaria TaxID=32244 RepID=A0AAD7KWM6_QUISA|nr:COP1-interacting protein 7 [Quillaja saponaria]